MKQLISIALIIVTFTACERKAPHSDFSFHLYFEPQHFDPAQATGSSASYFFFNTFRGLYKIDGNNQLVQEGGKCQWVNSLKLKCQLENRFWSNGSAVTAADYRRAFVDLIAPDKASPRAALLKNIKNAEAILSGQQPAENLGFNVLSSNSFTLTFEKADPEFIYKLSSTALYPKPSQQASSKEDFQKFIGNGPYVIDHWDFGHRLTLKPNPHYPIGHKKRPTVTIYFIDDDMTAFRLYEKRQLQFLRRIPTKMISILQERQDLFHVPMLRFDYIGFGENLLKNPLLRQALSQSIDYKKLGLLLHSLGPLGCPSIPRQWMSSVPCHTFDLKKAKIAWEKLDSKVRNQVYEIVVSQLGGDDIKKQAEFLQGQWKSHLGLKSEIRQTEQKVFLAELRSSPPDIFRKGVGLDYPTCRNALQTFSQDSKINFLNLDNAKYEKTIHSMGSEPNQGQYKKLCTQGVKLLMDNHLIIPLGEMHFTMMAHDQMTGWTINGLNQLDLSQLHPRL